MRSKIGMILCVGVSLMLSACATQRTVDNISLARIAKDYIGVASVDEITVSNVQKTSSDSALSMGRTNYRYFVDTARKKKFVCDVSLAGLAPEGSLIGQDKVGCSQR